jgi:hypothetical protein
MERNFDGRKPTNNHRGQGKQSQNRATRSAHIKQDTKATKENGYFYVVNTIVGGCEVKEKGETGIRTGNDLSIVNQNIRSLWGKCGELEMLLETEINNTEVLCFTEHRLNCHKIYAINIMHFTLANAFCGRNSDHGGSCIFVRKGVITKELNLLIELGEQKILNCQ